MKRRSSLMPFLFAVGVGAAGGAAGMQYYRQRRDALARLAAGGRVIETARGPIEYGEVGNGPAALVIHGVMGGYDMGLVITKPFLEAGMRVIAPSRFGYLGSPLPADGSPAAQADLFAAMLDTLKIKDVTVVGFSAGGPSAAEFAVRHPDRTRSLVMACAATRQRNVWAEERTPSMALLESILKSDLLAWLSIQFSLRTLPYMASSQPELQILLERPDLRTLYEQLSWSNFPGSVRRAGALNDAAQFAQLDLPLERIAVPTLVMHGTGDTWVPFETAIYTASQIPGARLARFEGAEHSFFITRYDETWPELIAFITTAKKKQAAAPKPKAAATPKKTTRKSSAKKPEAGAPKPTRRKPRTRKTAE